MELIKNLASIIIGGFLISSTFAQQFLPLAQTYSGDIGKAGNAELVIYCTGYSDNGFAVQPSFQGEAIIGEKNYKIFGNQRSDGKIQLDFNQNGTETIYVIEAESQAMFLGILKGVIYRENINGKKIGKMNLIQNRFKSSLYEGYFTSTSSKGFQINAAFTDFNGSTYLSLIPATTQSGIYGVSGKTTLETNSTKEFKEMFCKYIFLWEDQQLKLTIDNILGSSSCNPSFASKEKLNFKKM